MLPPSHTDAPSHAPCACCGVPSDELTRHGACPDCDGVHACKHCGTHADDDLPIDADGYCPDCAPRYADAGEHAVRCRCDECVWAAAVDGVRL